MKCFTSCSYRPVKAEECDVVLKGVVIVLLMSDLFDDTPLLANIEQSQTSKMTDTHNSDLSLGGDACVVFSQDGLIVIR